MSESLAKKIQAANRELIGHGNLKTIPDFFTPDYVAHLTDSDMKGGHVAIRKFIQAIRKSFPDVQVEVEVLVEGQDRVAWQRTLKATHQATFKGFPATGKEIVWRDMMVSELRDGLIAEEWVVSDLAERLLLGRKG